MPRLPQLPPSQLPTRGGVRVRAAPDRVAEEPGDGFTNAEGREVRFSIDATAFTSAFRAAELANIEYIWFNCARRASPLTSRASRAQA